MNASEHHNMQTAASEEVGVKPRREPRHVLMQVMIRDVLYNSAEDAAQALGVARCTIYGAIMRGTLDTVGLGQGKTKRAHRGGRPKSVTYGGMKFDTLADASLALGFRKQYLANALRVGRPGSLERIRLAALKFSADRDNKAQKKMRKAQQLELVQYD